MTKIGITRRIDELGRIVIPKEIRKNLKIRESDEIDISLDGNNIILNKHEINSNDRLINLIGEVMSKYLKCNVLFTSKEKIINYSLYDKSDNISLELSDEIINIINNRVIKDNYNSNIKLFKKEYFYIICPIIINGDVLGSLIIYSKDSINDGMKKILLFVQTFLENYLE